MNPQTLRSLYGPTAGCAVQGDLIGYERREAAASFAQEIRERTERKLREYFIDHVGTDMELFNESMAEWNDETMRLQMQLVTAKTDSDFVRIGRAIQARMKLAADTCAALYAVRESAGVISQAADDNERERWEEEREEAH